MFKRRLKSHHNAGGLLDKHIAKTRIDKKAYLNILNQKGDIQSKVMYIHIPFCDKICSFCNLNRTQLDNDLEEYTEYLLAEIRSIAENSYVKDNLFESIYFGGGTPTILRTHQLEKILVCITENYNLHDEYEWTFETTLHNLNNEKIELFNKYGVNRLSIGIQTFSDKGRDFLNRTYNKNEIKERINELKNKFKGYICADIIYNYQGQSTEEVREDAKLIKELKFDSVSFYSLMIHEGSKLSEQNIMLSDSAKDYDYFKAFYDQLNNDDEWELLELTKFVRKNRDKYKYITLRNTGADTLPLGVGAGGNVGDISVYNMKENMSFYVKQSDKHIKYNKLGGLLQFSSYDLIKIQKIIDPENYEIFLSCLKTFEDEGLGHFEENRFYLNSKGIFWGNNMSKYLCEKLIEKEFFYD